MLDPWVKSPLAKRSKASLPTEADRGSSTGDSHILETDRSSSDHGGDTSLALEVCDAECCVDGNTGKPFQVRNQSIIVRTRKRQGTKFRQFYTDWYNNYPWLVLCITTFKAFCYFCQYCFKNGVLLDHDDAFVRVGFDNLKKSHKRFRKHAKSQPHRNAMMKFELMKQPGIDSQLNSQCRASQELHRKMVQVLLSSIKYLV